MEPKTKTEGALKAGRERTLESDAPGFEPRK